jgi:hypothetical protein
MSSASDLPVAAVAAFNQGILCQAFDRLPSLAPMASPGPQAAAQALSMGGAMPIVSASQPTLHNAWHAVQNTVPPKEVLERLLDGAGVGLENQGVNAEPAAPSQMRPQRKRCASFDSSHKLPFQCLHLHQFDIQMTAQATVLMCMHYCKHAHPSTPCDVHFQSLLDHLPLASHCAGRPR